MYNFSCFGIKSKYVVLILSFFVMVILCIVIVHSTLSTSSFIKERKRAELFEITDKEVPIFRITVPKEDYALLRDKSKIYETNDPRIYVTNLEFIVYYYQEKVISELKTLKDVNFKALFPNEDLYKSFPELRINGNG